MRPLAVRWAMVGAVALAYSSTAGAQDGAAAGTPAIEPAPDEVQANVPAAPDPPAQPAPTELAGAANLTAAERAVQLTKGAQHLRQRASTEADSQKQTTEAQATELETRARIAKLEAFHPAEFAKTRDAARKIAAKAELRRAAAEKLVAEAAARHAKAEAAKAKVAKDPTSDDAEEAAAELAARKSELEAATKSKEKSVQAAILAALAAGNADEAVEAADVAQALTSAATAATERAETEAPPTRDDTLAGAAAMRKAIDEKKVEAFDKWLKARTSLDEYRQRLPAVDAAEENAKPAVPVSDSETLKDGARLSWGITGSLLRFQTQRSENLPGRNRNFRPRYEFVPGEAGFQFLVEPASFPWRLQLKNGERLQLMSWGGLLLASLGEEKALERGSLSLGATVVFFKNAIGLGGGFDLYRGIPVRGADGAPGSDTAFTGVLAWAFAQEGEVTAENAFVVVTVNLSSLIVALTGKENGDAAR
jgi:hypothetical protein